MPGTLPRIAYSPPGTTFQYLTRFRADADCNVLRCHEPRGAMSCGSPMPRGERIAKPAEWATRSAGFASWHRDPFDLDHVPRPCEPGTGRGTMGATRISSHSPRPLFAALLLPAFAGRG